MKHFRFRVRCIDGRLIRDIPDAPGHEADIGHCEACNGNGCEAPIAREQPTGRAIETVRD